MAIYNTYEGYKYSAFGDGRWMVTFPSGLRSVIIATDEDDLKSKIDTIIAGG